MASTHLPSSPTETAALHWHAHGGPFFETALQALHWAAEVIRARRSPRLSAIYRQVVPETGEPENPSPRNIFLPDDADTRYALAQTIMAAVGHLSAEQARLLLLLVWGDWADERRLGAALAIQERMRREGLRVRLSYRYSLRRLGEELGHDGKYAARRVNEAAAVLHPHLVNQGIVWEPGS